MPLLSCSVFLDKIESGAKTRTIRSPMEIPVFYQLNDLVSYGGFASTISVFEVTRIRGFSDCGQFVYLNWVKHPVPVSDIRPAVDKGNFWDKYSEVLENDQSGDSI